MNLTRREKEILNIFGNMNYEATIKKLGMACALMVDPLTKASASSLRNELLELPCDSWYRRIYCRIKKEMCNTDKDAA